MKKRLHISVDSPVVLSFTLLCVISLIVNYLTGGFTNSLLFSVYRSSLTSFWTYPRFFLHVLGHGSVSHLVNNIMLLLVTGPMLESHYGSKAILIVITATALVTGIVHVIIFPSTALLGASGVVFAFILLASAVNFKSRTIPLSFILVAVLYIGEQIFTGLTEADNISQLTHIIGGITGAFFGYLWRKKH